MSMDVKEQNFFPTLPKRPLNFFFLEFFFYILVVIVLNIGNAEICSPAFFTMGSAPNDGKSGVSRSSGVSYLGKEKK